MANIQRVDSVINGHMISKAGMVDFQWADSIKRLGLKTTFLTSIVIVMKTTKSKLW